MDAKKLYELLEKTTRVYRKGEVVERRKVGPVEVVEVFGYPPAPETTDEDLHPVVDAHFVKVGVNKDLARDREDDLRELLAGYPRPDRLAQGPSHIEVGAAIGSQEHAFRLFALGKALGLWDVVTPATFGFEGEEADRMAGSGFVMMSGYKEDAPR